MPSPTDFNLSPYYDDFNESKKFHRVLFRPAFAVQARELTQSQTILQNQIDRFGRHTFKEGSVVIPGNLGFTTEYFAVKLQDTFSGSSIASDISDYVGTRITGATSGVIAEVIEAVAATSTDNCITSDCNSYNCTRCCSSTCTITMNRCIVSSICITTSSSYYN